MMGKTEEEQSPVPQSLSEQREAKADRRCDQRLMGATELVENADAKRRLAS